MYVVNRHIVILLESRESEAHRQEHPRAKKRYVISCTCRQKRPADNHCIHTRAFMEDSIAPAEWKRITAKPMSAPDDPESSPNLGRATVAR